MLKEDREVKLENKEEDEESTMFKILTSLLQSTGTGLWKGTAGKKGNSVFIQVSQIGLCVVGPFIPAASLMSQVCMFCPHLR